MADEIGNHLAHRLGYANISTRRTPKLRVYFSKTILKLINIISEAYIQ